MNVCPGRAWLTIAITVKLIVSLSVKVAGNYLQVLTCVFAAFFFTVQLNQSQLCNHTKDRRKCQ